ncbi:hypothetical protein, N-terminal fragment (pseudogene) [Lactiplantibacillus plantarum WCFS1]|uniref:Uncharacterized protein n=1 Tax=Lactiplantibacillus plantarum (strain ATCC BAA-793 / NCIMB 8826 / WCFS1) TaxID=220668 RepID=F9UM14_LACPL|nr:hypothetical protein, N-terminal fragment (pseudogene) [Lactiplantibacillus plantarum WCFS1]
MDDFQQQINEWSDWQGLQLNAGAFEPVIQKIYASENEPYKTPEPVRISWPPALRSDPPKSRFFHPVRLSPKLGPIIRRNVLD